MTPLSTTSLKEHSERLCNPALSNDEAKMIIDEVHQHFTTITGISGKEESIERAAAVQTAYGKALGLNYAALCLVDYRRTVVFLQGFVAAIRKKQEENQGGQIKVFYAGCGPYAPFLTLVAPLFEPSEIQFTILDINPDSLNFAQDLIGKLGLESYVDNVILDDAVTCKVSEPEQYHILFSETLDALLSRECYVPILCNLAPQFAPGTLIIPENVGLILSYLAMDGEGKEVPLEETELVFESKAAIESTYSLDTIPESFPAKRVPFKRDRGITAVVLDTLVKVFEDYHLVRNESQLTQPYVFDVDSGAAFNTLVFTYNLKPEIGLFTGTE